MNILGTKVSKNLEKDCCCSFQHSEIFLWSFMRTLTSLLNLIKVCITFICCSKCGFIITYKVKVAGLKEEKERAT